eukprot:scaffold135524_cov46-Prasinocladus_malaysianus.AAC.1
MRLFLIIAAVVYISQASDAERFEASQVSNALNQPLKLADQAQANYIMDLSAQRRAFAFRFAYLSGLPRRAR